MVENAHTRNRDLVGQMSSDIVKVLGQEEARFVDDNMDPHGRSPYLIEATPLSCIACLRRSETRPAHSR